MIVFLFFFTLNILIVVSLYASKIEEVFTFKNEICSSSPDLYSFDKRVIWMSDTESEKDRVSLSLAVASACT